MRRPALPFLGLAVTFAGPSQAPPRMPIPNDYGNSIKTRWLNKPVEESKLVDDAESLSAWQLINSEQANGEMTLTKERSVSSTASLRLRCATAGDKPAPGRYFGSATARRVVQGENWSAWNHSARIPDTHLTENLAEIPSPWPVHEARINGVDWQASDQLQHISNGGCAGTGIRIVVYSIREHACKARSGLVPDEDVSVVSSALTADDALGGNAGLKFPKKRRT